MQFDKRTLLASLLIVLIFVFIQSDFYERLYGRLFGRAVPTAPAAVKTQTSKDSTAAAVLTFDTGDTLSATPGREMVVWQKEKQFEREIIVETPLYRGVLSTLGGTIKEWQFKKYFLHNGTPITIVQQGTDNLSVVFPGESDSLNTSQYNFTCKDSSIHLPVGGKHKLVFERELEPGKRVRKTYDFSADDYTIGLRLELENVNDLVAGYHYNLRWRTGLAPTEPSLKADMAEARAYTFIGEDLLDLDVGDKAHKELKEDERDIAWAATRTKYFTCAIVPASQPARGVLLSGGSTYVPGQETRLKSYQMDLKMPLARQSATVHDFKVYLGPIDYDRLEALGTHRLMNLGWSIIRPFSWMVLKSLQGMHNFVPNYGVVIIIFAFLIKIILHPLTKKTNESMKQMQLLQPKMKELQEKYAKDPQRLNEEVMKLYREYGVNP
ncbi:MAG: membrane protein insertase YidC, partial [candidate division KSB1 bacterium]|nr:membrane protein insertase YidC [candidate division KSB1 bacterium]